ncbi:MAG: hypothetical protein HQM09_16890 [Candidatus Riflebacteria bacterium]|nr:hypothetical protein [Candidatus Riflebacteria bacterium]
MFDALLLVSFLNILSLLPLFAGYRLAEHMSDQSAASIWEVMLASPGLLCMAVTLTSAYIGIKLARGTGGDHPPVRMVLLNAVIMMLIWVVPDLAKAPDWLRRTLIESWAVGASVILMLLSLYLPLVMIWRLLQVARKDNKQG